MFFVDLRMPGQGKGLDFVHGATKAFRSDIAPVPAIYTKLLLARWSRRAMKYLRANYKRFLDEIIPG